MAVSKALLGVLAVLACIQVIVAVDNDGPEGNQGGFSLDQLIQQLDLTTSVPVESSSSSEENQITKVPERQPLDPNFDESNSINIAKNVLDLSQKLVRNVLASSKKNYEILSPISIASALQLALLGSYGSTFNELMSVLGYNKNAMSGLSASTVHQQFGFLLEDLVSNDLNYTRARSQVPWRARASNSYINRANKAPKNNAIPNHTITVANGIFVQKGFSIRPEYNDAVKSVYNSEFRAMDFRSQPLESAKELNKWVNDKTNGRIKELIPGAVDSETLVILANALYFKADWQQTFIEGATSQKKFYPNGKDDAENFVMVDMMANGGDFAHYYDKESDCEILGLPYKKNASTMYVIMPKNSSSIVLKQKQELLTAEKIEFMISQMTIKTAVILFPKMHLSGGYHLKGSLLDLGLKALFKQGKSDLSLLADGSLQAAIPTLQKLDSIRRNGNLKNPFLFADEVIHKVDLEINEQGTEGGAATAITLNRSGTNVVFRTEVPFMILIRHDPTRLPLFYGTVFNPLS
ncbi:unnamed protein product [Diamesa hyperborea]